MKKTDTQVVKRTQKDYNLGFKLAIVDQVEKGELTYKQAQKLYGIQGRSTLNKKHSLCKHWLINMI